MLEATSMLCLSPMSAVPDATYYSPSCPIIALRQARRRATQHIARLTELDTQVIEVRREVASLDGQ
jgi:hypothetical protein